MRHRTVPSRLLFSSGSQPRSLRVCVNLLCSEAVRSLLLATCTNYIPFGTAVLPGLDSVIRHSPTVAAATVPAPRQPGTRIPDIPTAPVKPVATVVMMDVAAATISSIARRQRDQRRVLREISVPTVRRPGVDAVRPRLDAHRVVRIRDAMRLHRTTGELHFYPNAFAVPPR